MRFFVPASGRVTLHAYDLRGRLVDTILDDEVGAGMHSVPWNAGKLASGVYMCRIEAGSGVDSRKVHLCK